MEGTAQGVQPVLKTGVRASVGVRVLCPPPFQCSVTDTRSVVTREKGVRFLPLEPRSIGISVLHNLAKVERPVRLWYTAPHVYTC